MILSIPTKMYAHFNSDTVFDDLMHYQGECYRSQKGRMTKKIRIGDECYFIKQHPDNSARFEWRALQKCQTIGVPTADLIAYGENKGQSFVLMSAIKYKQSLEYGLGGFSFLLKRKLINEIATITRTFHDAGMNHRDLYLCHFLLDHAEKLYIIDLHRAQIHQTVPRIKLIKDLAALFYSSMNETLSLKDYAYFLKYYNGQTLKQFVRSHTGQSIIKKAIKLYQKDYGVSPGIASRRQSNPSLDNLFIESELRIVPNKRRVVKGTWQGRSVVVKIFSSAKKYNQELHYLTLCKKEKIIMPELLHQDGSGNLFYLIFEFVEKFKEVTIDDLIDIVANHHRHNLIQTDMHVNNFIATKSHIITLDAGSMISSCNEKKFIDNLALLFSQFTLDEDAINHYLIRYCELRGLTYDRHRLTYLLNKIQYCQKKRQHQRIEKLFRTCTAITRTHRFGKTVLLHNNVYTPALGFFLHHIKSLYVKKWQDYTVECHTSWAWQKNPLIQRWIDLHLTKSALKPIALVIHNNGLKKTAYLITG